jgi:hypothetical protein
MVFHLYGWEYVERDDSEKRRICYNKNRDAEKMMMNVYPQVDE